MPRGSVLSEDRTGHLPSDRPRQGLPITVASGILAQRSHNRHRGEGWPEPLRGAAPRTDGGGAVAPGVIVTDVGVHRYTAGTRRRDRAPVTPRPSRPASAPMPRSGR
jgi:hypothetical protein